MRFPPRPRLRRLRSCALWSLPKELVSRTFSSVRKAGPTLVRERVEDTVKVRAHVPDGRLARVLYNVAQETERKVGGCDRAEIGRASCRERVS